MNIPSPFSADEPAFDAYDEFVPERIPDPGAFLDSHDVLTGRDHLLVHRLARDLFEERGVYDMTFGYNLARLNLDPRHPDAGFRYAVEDPEETADSLAAADGDVLRATFTPTTAFCPQSDTLAMGAFRAFNGLSDRHEYALVRVRVADLAQESDRINERLRAHGRQYAESGTLPDAATGAPAVSPGGQPTTGYSEEGAPF